MAFGRRSRRIKRLLVVEDEPLVAFDNEHALSDAGFEVVATVPRADAAVEALAAGVDLVLSDIQLADGTGLDVARAAQAAGVPILFVSSLCPPEAEALAVGCLAKPYAQRDLLAAIDVVDRRMAGERVRRLPPGLRLFEEIQVNAASTSS